MSTAQPQRSLISRLYNDRRLRYLAFGGLNTLFAFLLTIAMLAVFAQFMNHHVDYIAANATTWVITTITSFLLQRVFVFKVTGNRLRDFIRFSGVTGASALLNTALWTITVEFFGLTSQIEKTWSQLVITGVLVIGTYFVHRDFSFRRTATAPEQADAEAEAGAAAGAASSAASSAPTDTAEAPVAGTAPASEAEGSTAPGSEETAR